MSVLVVVRYVITIAVYERAVYYWFDYCSFYYIFISGRLLCVIEASLLHLDRLIYHLHSVSYFCYD